MGKKLVVITGASSGIGRETTIFLAKRGYHVIACVRRSKDGERLRLECPDNMHYRIVDVNHAEQVEELREYVSQFFNSRSDVSFFALVNNAGVSPVAPIELVSMEELDFIFRTNVYGTVRMIQAMLPFLKCTTGRIVNISSGSGVMAIPLSGAYSMSKFAVEALSDVLRVELRQFNIHVAVVEPGLIRTPIHEKNALSMEHLLKELTAPQRDAYARQLRHYVDNQGRAAASATPPIEVSKVIATALESRRPRSRYGAGRDAKALRWIHWLLSDRLRDLIVSRIGGW